MLSGCITVASGIILGLLGVVFLVGERSSSAREGPPAKTGGGALALSVVSMVVGVMFGPIMLLWGCWEVFQCVLGLHLLTVAPLAFVFWALTSLADLIGGVMFIVVGVLGIAGLKSSPERQASLARTRQALGFAMPVVGLVAVVLGVLYVVL